MTAQAAAVREHPAPRPSDRLRAAMLRAGMSVALAALLGGCVPLGVRVQNMFAALLG